MFKFSHYIPQSGRLFSLHAVLFFFSVCEYLWPQRTLARAHNWVSKHPTAAKSSWSPWGPQRAVWAHRTLWKTGHLAAKARKVLRGYSDQPLTPTDGGWGKSKHPSQPSYKWGKFKTLSFATDFCFLTFLTKAETSHFPHTLPTRTHTLAAPVTDREVPTPPLCLGSPHTLQPTVTLLYPGAMGTSVHITNFADFPSVSPSHSLWASSHMWTIETALSQLVWWDSHFSKITHLTHEWHHSLSYPESSSDLPCPTAKSQTFSHGVAQTFKPGNDLMLYLMLSPSIHRHLPAFVCFMSLHVLFLRHLQPSLVHSVWDKHNLPFCFSFNLRAGDKLRCHYSSQVI